MPMVTTNIPIARDVWPEVLSWPKLLGSIALTIMRAISLPKPLGAVKYRR